MGPFSRVSLQWHILFNRFSTCFFHFSLRSSSYCLCFPMYPFPFFSYNGAQVKHEKIKTMNTSHCMLGTILWLPNNINGTKLKLKKKQSIRKKMSVKNYMGQMNTLKPFFYAIICRLPRETNV